MSLNRNCVFRRQKFYYQFEFCKGEVNNFFFLSQWMALDKSLHEFLN